MIEEMTTEELIAEYRECADWISGQADQDSPRALSTADFMYELRLEYHFRTEANIDEA